MTSRIQCTRRCQSVYNLCCCEVLNDYFCAVCVCVSDLDPSKLPESYFMEGEGEGEGEGEEEGDSAAVERQSDLRYILCTIL